MMVGGAGYFVSGDPAFREAFETVRSVPAAEEAVRGQEAQEAEATSEAVGDGQHRVADTPGKQNSTEETEEVLEQADTALYRAKRDGGNRVSK